MGDARIPNLLNIEIIRLVSVIMRVRAIPSESHLAN